MTLSLKENKKSHLVFRTEGGHQSGMGHFMRCLRLARYLGDRLSLNVTFVLSPSDISLMDFFRGTPYEAHVLEERKEAAFLSTMCRDHRPRAWITDLRQAEDKSLFQALAQRHGFLHAAIDDMHLGGIEAEIAFNPSILPCAVSAHSNCQCDYYCGPEYFFSFPGDTPPPSLPKKNGKRILIAMGGADVHGVTPKLLRSFQKAGGDVCIYVVLGPAFQRDIQTDFSGSGENIFFYHSPASLDPLISFMDLVITTGGVTLYETARLGVASITVTQNPFESQTAQAFRERGAGLFLGEGDKVEMDSVVEAALSLLRDDPLLQAMSRTGQRLVTGGGAEKMAKILESRL